MARLGEEERGGGGGIFAVAQEGVVEGVEKAAVGVGFAGVGGEAAADVGEAVVVFLGGLGEGLQWFDPGGRGWFGQEGFDERVSLGQERGDGEFLSVWDGQELLVEGGDLEK